MSVPQEDIFDAPPAVRGRARLVGIGRDGTDGHVRMTDAEGLHLVGGTARTHALMQERGLALLAAIRRRGIDLSRLPLAECRALGTFLERLP